MSKKNSTPPPEWVKQNSQTLALAKNEPGLRDACPLVWLNKPTCLFTDALFSPDDLVEVVSSGIGTSVHRYSEVRKNLHAYDGINPNRMWSRQEPGIKARRYLVVRFLNNGNLDAEYRRTSYLAKSMPLTMIVFDPVARTLECWFYVEDRQPGEITAFFKRCMECGADGKTSLAGFKAKIPAGLCTLLQTARTRRCTTRD